MAIDIVDVSDNLSYNLKVNKQTNSQDRQNLTELFLNNRGLILLILLSPL